MSSRIRSGRGWQKAVGKSNLNFWEKLAIPSGIADPGYNDRLPAGLLRSVPFDQDHVCLRCAVAHFAWFAIFLAIEPFLGAVS